jgi:hypothetical protein
MLTVARIGVTASAARAVGPDPSTIIPATTPEAFRSGTYPVALNNISGNTVYVGGADTVTSATGYPLAAANQLFLVSSPGDEVWLIAGVAGPSVVAVLVNS